MARVIVVGGGVFGIAAAIELNSRGHAVRLLEPAPIPRPEAASTDISKLIRMDYGADALYTTLMERALERWRAWNREPPGPPLFHEDGLLALSGSALSPGTFEGDSHALLSSRGHRLERLARGALAGRFPEWNATPYPDGYFNPAGGWAESGKVVERLAERARSAGVAIEHALVAQLLPSGVATKDGAQLAADAVVVAAGAWTPVLLPELVDRIVSVGQPVLHFRPKDPRRFLPPRFVPWAADIANTGWYGFPANAEGIVKVANHGTGTPIHPDLPRAVDAGAEARFRSFLAESIPALADAPLVGSRLCLYSDSFDGDFFIGRHPDRPGVVVASGGSGHGFKFAPLLGELAADALEGKSSEALGRFAWRAPGRRTTEAARHLAPGES
jgi:glycine/D-amino acid oxidase-like deaminating enzyme